jgi:hypothetical protein
MAANLTADLFENFGNDATAEDFMNTWLDRPTPPDSPERYRVILGDQVVGWLHEPSWLTGEISASWTYTTSAAGKAFSQSSRSMRGTRVRVETTGDITGLLRIDDGRARFQLDPPDAHPEPAQQEEGA